MQFVTRPEFRAIYDGFEQHAVCGQVVPDHWRDADSKRTQGVDRRAGTAGEASRVLFKVVDGTTTTTGGVLVFNTTYGKTFYDNLFNAAFVQMEYFGYLLRDPDDGGYAFWLGKLNSFGDWVNAEMVKAFIKSPEYRARFGAP